MTDESSGETIESKARFDAIIGEFLEVVKAGRFPDRLAILEANPGLTDELIAFFAGYDQLRGLASRRAAEAGIRGESSTQVQEATHSYMPGSGSPTG